KRVRNNASFPNGNLDEKFDRRFILEIVSKWADPSVDFLELQARYTDSGGTDAMRVANAFSVALGEEAVTIDGTPSGAVAMAFGNDISAIALKDLDRFLRDLPEDQRREVAKAVIARFSNSKRLKALASSPDTRRALATLGQSLSKLTGTQHAG